MVKKAFVTDVFSEAALTMLQKKDATLSIVKENLNVLLWHPMALPAIKNQDTRLFLLVTSMIYFFRSGDFKPFYTAALHAEVDEIDSLVFMLEKFPSIHPEFMNLLAERVFIKSQHFLFCHWKNEKPKAPYTYCSFEISVIKRHFKVANVLQKVEPRFQMLFIETPFLAEISNDCTSILVGPISSYYKNVICGTGLESTFFTKFKEKTSPEIWPIFVDSLDKDEKQLFLKIVSPSETKANK
jgi:hypothetical protein